MTSEQSSLVYEGAAYNEVYPLGRELVEDLTWSPKRDLSAHSLVEEENEGVKEEEEEKGDEEEEEEEEEKREEEEGDEEGQAKGDGVISQVDGSGYKPFILPLIWVVNDFYPMMSLKVFNTLHDCYQIPENIPLWLPGNFEKCYLGKIADIGMYDAMFIAGLRLSLTELHC